MGKYTLDELSPANIINKWTSVSTDFEQSVQFTIARRYFKTKHNIQILHILFYVSQKSFGAAAYLTSGSTVALVAEKARVATVEKRTLPQQELEAAELGTKLAEIILTALSSSLNIWIKSIQKKAFPVLFDF